MSLFEQAQNLSEIDKYRLYFRYLVSCYSLKNCHVVTFTRTENGKIEDAKSEVFFNPFFQEPVSFKQFIDANNIRQTDAPEKWKHLFPNEKRIDYPIYSLCYWYQFQKINK